MSVWSRLFARRAIDDEEKARQASASALSAQLLPLYLAATQSGMTYAQMVAAYQSWVYIAVNKIAQTVASIPLRLYAYKSTSSGKWLRAPELKRAGNGVPAWARGRWLKAQGVERVEIPEHPLLTLLQRPNTWQTRFTLWQDTVTKLELGGQCGWYVGAGVPTQIIPLPLRSTAILEAVADPKLIIGGWLYKDGAVSQKIAREEMIALRYPSPVSPLDCQSPLAAQQYPYNIDRYLEQLINNTYENRAFAGVVLSTADRLTDKQVKQIASEINTQLGGVANAGKPLVLHSGLKPEGNMRVALNDVISELVSKGTTRDKLLSAYGVPAGKVGLVEDVNRANMEALDKTYLQESIKPRLMLIEEVLESELLPRYDERLMADFILPEQTERETDIKERAANLTAGYTTVNEERAKENLEPVAWGEAPWLPYGLTQPVTASAETSVTDTATPADAGASGGGATGEGLLPETVLNGAQVQAMVALCQSVIAGFPRANAVAVAQVSFGLSAEDAERIIPAQGEKPVPVAPSVPPGQTKPPMPSVEEPPVAKAHTTKLRIVWDEKRRRAAAQVFVAEHSKWEGKMVDAAVRVFHAQRDYVLARVGEGLQKQLGQTAGWSKRRVAMWVKSSDATARYNLDKRKARAAVVAEFAPLHKSTVEAFGTKRGQDLLNTSKASSVGVAFNVNDKRVQTWLGDRLEKFSDSIVGTTFDAVKSILRAGFEAGDPESVIAERLREKFASYEQYRAQLIARTEVTAAANFGDLESVVQAGLDEKLLKVWIDSGDEATRDDHVQAGIDYADGIPIDRQFTVGKDHMDAPGDGQDAAQNINCRCSIGYTERE